MPRKAELLKSLTRGRIRASMNKYNLFNLYKKARPDFRSLTLYQQKWLAKNETRAYHGEHLTESRWQTVFSPSLKSVAQLDALQKQEEGVPIRKTPIQLQTYAVLEKRLDFALFRAMFASSIRQARQFILHGEVKVNGVTIKSPGYELKAGDIFSCSPEKVLFALGRKKPELKESVEITAKQITKWNEHVKSVLNDEQKQDAYVTKYFHSLNKEKQQKIVEQMKDSTKVDPKQKIVQDAVTTAVSKAKSLKEGESLSEEIYQEKYGLNKEITSKLLSIYNIVVEEFHKQEELLTKDTKQIEQLVIDLLTKTESSKKLREIKQLCLEINRSLSDPRASEEGIVDPSVKEHILNSLKKQRHQALPVKEVLASDNISEALSQFKITLPFQKHLFGRQKSKKPYFTPWEPRQFLAPFAILPHHLEISFKTCHAIYLRDPIARPGESEVISPFDTSVHGRAYMYYARKGK